MRYQLLSTFALLVIVFASSCKKDEEADGEDNVICTETRPVWLDGSVGDFEFVTSEPCANLRVEEEDVYHYKQGGFTNLFTFVAKQKIVDSLGVNHGIIDFSISAEVPDSLIDTYINGTDTSVTVSPNNICKVMKLGQHYHYIHQALSNNANGFYAIFVDSIGKEWRIAATANNDSLVVTSIDGIISQSPFSGAYFPYCVCTFNYNLLMQEFQGNDTIRLQGTGRLGFR